MDQRHRFNGESASTSDGAVLTSYFAIFRDQTRNKYGAYLFRVFLVVKIALPEVCADWLLKISWDNWHVRFSHALLRDRITHDLFILVAAHFGSHGQSFGRLPWHNLHIILNVCGSGEGEGGGGGVL